MVWGYRFSMLQLNCLPSGFFIQVSIIHDNISSQIVGEEKVGCWPKLEVIHHLYHYGNLFQMMLRLNKGTNIVMDDG